MAQSQREDATMYIKAVAEALDMAADGMATSFRLIDAKDVFRTLVEGKLPAMLSTYAECLNEVALMRGRGYAFDNARFLEVERLVKECERWIAQKVLQDAGWETISTTMYYKEQKNKE